MRKVAFPLIALAVVLGLASCQPKETKLYVASINDMHANINNFPKLAYVLDSLRAAHPDMLLFSAGDNRSGNPFNDRYGEPSRPMIELMNATGFDLCELGNHEWDDGPGNLRQMVEWANFPFICANVKFEDSLNIPVKPYVVLERNGLKIGVIGGIAIEEGGIPAFHPKNAGGSHFKLVPEVLPDYIGLRDSCDVLFLLSHCGFEEDVELAKQYPQFDAIFGGHSHTLVDSLFFVNDVLITQAMNKIKYLTFSTFTLSDGRIVKKESVVIPIENRTLRNDAIQAMVDKFNDNEVFQQALGENDTEIKDCRECLGDLMADAYREAAGADMAFQNHGGVRIQSLPAGPITLGDLFTLDPFDNGVVSLMMTGKEVVDFIDASNSTDHGLNLCSGCTYSYVVDGEGNKTDFEVTLDNGKPLEMDKKYKVAMNNYMISAFPFEHEDPGMSEVMSSNEALTQYLQRHPHVDYAGVSRISERK
ncbi:MAG: bifunctional metallophosphatase/5'-nucleotidase [Bacteroidales bacterium]|nr:bifunctional metallophosphatase/5'-nucleotidase [Bacteroidales bacterium]